MIPFVVLLGVGGEAKELNQASEYSLHSSAGTYHPDRMVFVCFLILINHLISELK